MQNSSTFLELCLIPSCLKKMHRKNAAKLKLIKMPKYFLPVCQNLNI